MSILRNIRRSFHSAKKDILDVKTELSRLSSDIASLREKLVSMEAEMIKAAEKKPGRKKK